MTFRLAVVHDTAFFEDSSVRTRLRSPQQELASPEDQVYRLALGMLWHPVAAERASQEIQEATRGAPRGSLGARVSILRAAVRALLERELSPFERQRWTFEALAMDLARGLDEPLPPIAFGAGSLALVEEVKLGCSQTMLLCLDRPHRIAYLVARLEAMDAETGAAILELEVEEFRKRALRAEELVRGFMNAHCGLVNAARPCRCNRRLGRALVTGRVDPDELLFAGPSTRAG